MRTGIANLPLHSGKAPRWLFSRMKELSQHISTFIISEFGPDEMLMRLSDPFWFQAFGCVLGFDWHSSGVTTTVCGALKEGVKGIEDDLGFYVAGGKGSTSRKTPHEIFNFCQTLSLNPAPLVYASKMSAKVDSAALQDGYQIYQHTFFFTSKGNWSVIQQGMNIETQYARRYHWLSNNVNNFVNEPHSAVCCNSTSKVLNMVANESSDARKISAMVSTQEPLITIKELKRLKTLSLPSYHCVSLDDINPAYLEKILLKTYEVGPQNFEAILAIEGVGPKTIRSLSLIAELVYGSEVSIRDPVRFSFAHGGKDGHPYPVDRVTYDKSIQVLKRAIKLAKIGRTDKLKALSRLSSYFLDG